MSMCVYEGMLVAKGYESLIKYIVLIYGDYIVFFVAGSYNISSYNKTKTWTRDMDTKF